ncbi:MAG: hypothetical protein NDJ75_03980 [Thermoanaerobaculia bacterium]|nr:hypothetical protein [Thermoanaerobaculia bacterium]
MKSCEEYEIDLSSWLDGEAAAAVAAEAIAHATTCASCGAFFRAAQRLADPARSLADDEAGLSDRRAEALWLEIRRVAAPGAGATRAARSWARGLRAAALVVAGLGGGYLLASLGGAPAAAPGAGLGIAVPAATRPGDDMDERRFVALAGELMRAEPRYQRAMLEILRLVPALETGEGLGHDEASPFVRARIDDARQGEL